MGLFRIFDFGFHEFEFCRKAALSTSRVLAVIHTMDRLRFPVGGSLRG